MCGASLPEVSLLIPYSTNWEISHLIVVSTSLPQLFYPTYFIMWGLCGLEMSSTLKCWVYTKAVGEISTKRIWQGSRNNFRFALLKNIKMLTEWARCLLKLTCKNRNISDLKLYIRHIVFSSSSYDIMNRLFLLFMRSILCNIIH